MVWGQPLLRRYKMGEKVAVANTGWLTTAAAAAATDPGFLPGLVSTRTKPFGCVLHSFSFPCLSITAVFIQLSRCRRASVISGLARRHPLNGHQLRLIVSKSPLPCLHRKYATHLALGGGKENPATYFPDCGWIDYQLSHSLMPGSSSSTRPFRLDMLSSLLILFKWNSVGISARVFLELDMLLQKAERRWF